MKRKLLVGLLIGSLAIIPALNVSNAEAKSKKSTTVTVEQTIDNTKSDQNSKDKNRPPMKNDQSTDKNGQPPEPPKDENGNPLPPPNHDSDHNSSDHSNDRQHSNHN
ncbi:MAG: hypothetical protein IJU71_08930 [Selenomonadaceae bacterium]|nr:hypothetical protein [Selenomonadaceae bacterium]